jgi:Holliday junction DNA helicase RuvB
MEDYRLDIIIDQGPQARSLRCSCQIHPHRCDHSRRHGERLALALRDDCATDYYTAEEMQKLPATGLLTVEIDHAGAAEIAARTRTPHREQFLRCAITCR